ncbi:hypothetical protein D9M69_725050 [compost metagenome]
MTWKPPGNTPSVATPRFTQACITAQIRSSPERTAAASRQASSLCHISCAMLSPLSAQRCSSSSPLVKGYGKTVASGTSAGSPASLWLITKPPPME